MKKDKKVRKKKAVQYDGTEDLDIKNVAYFKSSSQVILLIYR